MNDPVFACLYFLFKVCLLDLRSGNCMWRVGQRFGEVCRIIGDTAVFSPPALTVRG